MIIIIEILTVDSIEVKYCQATAIRKRTFSDGSNAVPNGYRSQICTILKYSIIQSLYTFTNGCFCQSIATIEGKIVYFGNIVWDCYGGKSGV